MKKSKIQVSEETRIVHGTESHFTTSGDLVPPIHMTSTFKFDDMAHGAGIFKGTRDGFVYSRISNPSVDLLQEKIANLEGGESAIALSCVIVFFPTNTKVSLPISSPPEKYFFWIICLDIGS